MKAFLFITLLSVSALSARGQSGEWHSLMSAPDRFRHAWLSSDKSTIAAETINGYFIIFDVTSGKVLRYTACVPRVATREVVSFPGKSAVSSATQDTALVLTCDVDGRSANQFLDLIDVRSGVTLRRVDLRSQLPDNTRGYFCELQWDHASGVVTLGLRRVDRNSPVLDAFYQLTLNVNEKLSLISDTPTYTYYHDYDLWLHPFAVDQSSYPEQIAIFRRDSRYLVSNSPNKTVVYQPPSTEVLWTVNEIPLALIDSTLITVDVGLQRTHHRRLQDGALIRSHQYGEGVFHALALSPRDVFHAQSPSQRYIKTTNGMIDLLNGAVFQVARSHTLSVTNDGDVIEFGDPHGTPMTYALRRNGYRVETPSQLIGALASVLEVPATGELIYSTRGHCTSLGGFISGVIGELRENVPTVGLVLDDGLDANDRYLHGVTLHSIPTSSQGSQKIFGCFPVLSPWFAPERPVYFDASSKSKIGDFFTTMTSFWDPPHQAYYILSTEYGRMSSFDLTYQPNSQMICTDTFYVEPRYTTYIVKGTGQLVAGKYVYDGKSCAHDSMDLGSAIAVGTMRPLALLTKNNDLILVDMSTWPVTELWRTTIALRMSVTFADQDHSVRCIDSTGRLHNINVNDGTVETMPLPSWPDSVLRIHWSADGLLITAEPHVDQMITTWDHRGTMLRQLPYPDPYDRRIIVTSETARIFVTTNEFSERSGFATWWSDGITPTPTTVQGSPTDLHDELLSYPVRVYSTLGQHITTIAAPSDLTTLRHGLYIFVNADGRSFLRLAE